MAARYPTIGDQPVLNPLAQYEAAQRLGTPLDFWQRANSYRNPLGQEPSTAYLLVPRSTIDALDVNEWHSLKWYTEDGTIEVPQLVIARATCMNRDGDSKGAYLLELRDRRNLFRLTATEKQYNLRLPEYETSSGKKYYPETMNSSSAWTWQEVLDDLWESLPGETTGPTLPYAPDETPEELSYVGVSTWDAIGEFLAAIGCAVQFDPVNDTFAIIKLGEIQAGLAAAESEYASRLMYDYKPKQELNLSELPETIRVLFPRQPDPRRDRWEIALPHMEDVVTGASGAATDTVLSIWDDLVAETDIEGDVTNTSELSARAAAVAQRYYNLLSRGSERRRQHYSGIVSAILPGSEIREVVWRDYGPGGLVTEIHNFPAEARGEVKRRMRPVLTLRGITVDAITHATPGTVQLVKRTSAGYEYLRDTDDTILEVEAGGYLFNTSETVEANIAVLLEQFPDGSWEISNANCAARDWELEDEEEEE